VPRICGSPILEGTTRLCALIVARDIGHSAMSDVDIAPKPGGRITPRGKRALNALDVEW